MLRYRRSKGRKIRLSVVLVCCLATMAAVWVGVVGSRTKANFEVVYEKVNFAADKRKDLTLTGSIALTSGLHPAEAVLLCDKDLPEPSANVTFSFLVRPPEASRFTRDAATFLHMTGDVLAVASIPDSQIRSKFHAKDDKRTISQRWAVVLAPNRKTIH